MANDSYNSDRFGSLRVDADAVRSVHARITGHGLEERVALELAEMIGTLPHLHATEPVIL